MGATSSLRRLSLAFGSLTEPPYTDALTDRFQTAVDPLVGWNRWEITKEMGWWPVHFPGFDDPPYGTTGTSKAGGSATTSGLPNRRS